MSNTNLISEELSNNILVEKEIAAPVLAEGTHSGWAWKGYEKFAFRAFAAFVGQLCVPLSPQFFERLGRIDWSNLGWQGLGGLASGFGAPDYIEVEDIWGLESYTNFFVAFLIAVGIAVIWSVLDRKPRNYDLGYYWIRVIARYRLAFGIIAWGYKKLIPMQMEVPPFTFLETPFADFSEQKLYWQVVGNAQNYEIFLGSAEVLGGILLLFRKTTALGAALVAVLLLNIAIANHAYEGMVHVHSFTYAVLGALLLWKYLPNIVALVVKEQDVLPRHIQPDFQKGWLKTLRLALKSSAIAIFVFYLLYLQATDPVGYRYPHDSAGLRKAAGVYGITEFRIDNKVVPYSPLDSVRWQDAIFEKWSTFTFLVNRKQHMDIDNTGREGKESIEKRFEFRGIGGGRHYFDYKADTLQKVLYLQNKNKAHRDQKMVLHYEQPSASRIILKGTNEFQDSIYVVLDRKNKTYALKAEPSVLPFYRPATFGY